MAANTLNAAKGKNALTLNDLALLEERFGNLSDIEFTRFVVLRCVLWLSLRKQEPGLTEDQVGDRFDLTNLLTEVTPILQSSGLAAGEDDVTGKAAAV